MLGVRNLRAQSCGRPTRRRGSVSAATFDRIAVVSRPPPTIPSHWQQRSPNPRESEHPLDDADGVLDLGPRPRHTSSRCSPDRRTAPLRFRAMGALVLEGSTLSACVLPEWGHFEAVGVGSSLPVPFGHKGTRALFVFDEGGRLVRTEVRGTGRDDTAGAEGSATPPPVPAPAVPARGNFGKKGVVRAWLAGHGPWLMVQRRDEVQVCALPSAEPVGSLPGGFLDAGVSTDGRLAGSSYPRQRAACP